MLDGLRANKYMNIDTLETQRVAGDITLILEQGTEEEKSSLLRVIEALCGEAERNRVENFVKEELPFQE